MLSYIVICESTNLEVLPGTTGQHQFVANVLCSALFCFGKWAVYFKYNSMNRDSSKTILMKRARKHEPSVGVLHLELKFHIQLLPTMCLVNCCIVNVTTNKTIFPWPILSTGVTVKQFYEEKDVNKLNSPEEVELEAAFLGKSKESRIGQN